MLCAKKRLLCSGWEARGCKTGSEWLAGQTESNFLEDTNKVGMGVSHDNVYAWIAGRQMIVNLAVILTVNQNLQIIAAPSATFAEAIQCTMQADVGPGSDLTLQSNREAMFLQTLVGGLGFLQQSRLRAGHSSRIAK